MERFMIQRDSDIGIAVVGIQSIARRLGFEPDQISRLATAASELATNICKYSPESGGDLVVSSEESEDGKLQLKVQVRDNGPGISDVEQALMDHYSSSGTLGLGLPGVKRIVDEFDIISKPGEGTVVCISVKQRR